MDAAIGLFAKRSIEAVTVDEIAAAADVGKGTIYNYFRVKEDIVVAFLAQFEKKVQQNAHRLEVGDRPAAEVLMDFIRLHFQMKARHHPFVRAFFAQMFVHTDEFRPHMAEIRDLTMPAVEMVFTKLRERGAIRRDVDLADLVLVFTNIHFGLSALWAIEGPPFRGTDHVLEREIRLFCEGLEGQDR
jgi:AcrR family transcriptional regulator